MTTLLDKAKKHVHVQNRWKHATDEELQVALAWINGEINLPQVCVGLELPMKKSSNGLYRIAVLLKEAYRRGMLIKK